MYLTEGLETELFSYHILDIFITKRYAQKRPFYAGFALNCFSIPDALGAGKHVFKGFNSVKLYIFEKEK